MAIITTYPLAVPTTKDYVVGSQITNTGTQINPTKNFRIGDISTLVKDDILGYNAYTSLVTQAGLVAPTDIVLKNDTGATMTWAYVGLGVYTCTASSPIFTLNKTICFGNLGKPAIANKIWTWTRTSDTVITIEMSPLADDQLGNGAFEIRIYS